MPGLEDPAGPPLDGAARASPSGGARLASGMDDVGEGTPDDARVTAEAKPSPPPAPARDVDPMIGTVIAGRYRVERRLGEGGMGAVYRVEHTHMRKKLALKVLHREMTTQTEIVARFEREAMASAHIDHPNVAGATDFGKLEDGSFYLVLEYVEGTSLRTEIDKGPFSPYRAVHVSVQILAALRRAHELGIVHRDLKPENILLLEKDGDPDFVKVLDFGIARVPIGSLISGGDSGPSLTRAGMVYGTPEYMAPEQALGQAVDGRSDLYGTGVMLFEMLTGRRPYDNKDKVALLGQHVAGPIPSLRERAPVLNLSHELEVVVTRLLSKSPSDRYADASDAIDALQSMPLEGTPVLMLSSRNPSRRGGAVNVADNSGRYDVNIKSGPISPPVHTAEPSVSAVAPAPQFALPQPAITEPETKPKSRGALFAVLLVIIAAGVIGLVLFKKQGSAPTDTSSGKSTTNAPSTSTSTVASVTPLSPAELKDKADKALTAAESGNPQGLADLESLAATHDGDPVVLIDLAKAYSKSKRHVEAIGAVKRLITASPESATNAAIGPILDAALPSSADTVFNLLTGPMGAEGVPILFDIGYGNRGPANLRPRAKSALAEPEVQKVMPPAIKGVLELMKTGSCDGKKKVLDTYRKDLDARALPLLRPLTATTGCGPFFKNKDCWPCLHAAKYLDTVLKEIEARSKK